MRLVDVDRTRELRLLPDGFAEDEDLLEQEAGERLHLGRPVLRCARKRVERVQRSLVKKFALSCDLALKIESIYDYRYKED